MNKVIFIVILALFSLSTATDDNYKNLKVKSVVRIYDGDTFFADLKAMPDIIGKNIGIRIRGIDTPEIRGGDCKELAYEVRNYVAEKLLKAKKIELKNVIRGKYFRIVADVYIDELNLGQHLIDKGYAYQYDGGTKQVWICDN